MKIRILILLTSVVLVTILLWGGQILINQLSGRQQEIQQEIPRRENALSEKIHVKIIEEGYQESRGGHQLVYNPVLVVEISNVSREDVEMVRLVAYFKKNGGLICSGNSDTGMLQPGEIKAVVIICPELAENKSSPRRPDLKHMEKSISYELWLETKDIKIVVENGILKQKILSRHPSTSSTYPSSPGR